MPSLASCCKRRKIPAHFWYPYPLRLAYSIALIMRVRAAIVGLCFLILPSPFSDNHLVSDNKYKMHKRANATSNKPLKALDRPLLTLNLVHVNLFDVVHITQGEARLVNFYGCCSCCFHVINITQNLNKSSVFLKKVIHRELWITKGWHGIGCTWRANYWKPVGAFFNR